MHELQRLRAGGLGGFQHPLFRLSDPIHKASWLPALDLVESDDAFVVTLEVPGCKAEDIEVTFEAGNLVVRGEKRSQATAAEGGYRRIERTFGQFERAVRLGVAVDGERISAECQHGVLRVTLPKAAEARPRQITIG
jgi:HSP20 family protein